MSLRTGPLGLGEEIVPPDEDALIERLAALHRDAQESRDVKERPVPRGQHPKHHGGVWADFRVEPHPSAEYRHGLFAEAKTHRALIRFS
ncbi:MAG TPA: hypothetical protein VGE52_05035, partial [Pirellulales bacterium]